MTHTTCSIGARDYSEWSYSPADHKLACPRTYKLFDGDIFSRNEDDGKITLVESIIKKDKNIPGILLLENNKTYGRT
jgi:hypothetical protein